MWEAVAIIAVVIVVDLCIIGIYKALRRKANRCNKKTKKENC